MADGAEIPSAPPKRRPGRPIGACNYGGRSHIAREFKIRGVYWRDELIDAYFAYKKQRQAYEAGQTTIEPDATLLNFWIDALPYVDTKMIEKETRRQRPKAQPKRRVSASALAQLARLEGRKPV